MRETPRRREEGTLKEAYDSQKAHLDHLFASLREAVVLVDNQGTVREVNPEFERLFGYTREKVLGGNIDDLIAPDDLEEEASGVTSSVVEGRQQLLETKRRRMDGSLVDVSVLASPISVGGDIVGFYGIYRDISDRKRAEAELRREKAHLDRLFRSLLEAIVLVDNRGTVKEVNPEFERLFGYTRGEALGRNIDDLIAPEGLEEEAREVTSEVIDGRETLLETRRRRSDGSLVDVSVLAAPITYDRGVVGFYGIYRDITQRKRATERLARSRERIERLHEITGRLERCTTEAEVYEITVSCGCGILSFEECTVYVVTKDRLAPSFYSNSDMEGQLEETAPGRGLPGSAFMRQRTMLPEAGQAGAGDCFVLDGRTFRPILVSPIGSFGVFVGYSAEAAEPDAEQVSLLKMHLGHLSEAIKRIRLHEELKEQALHDPLTGVFNRNYFNRFIEKEVERSSRYSHGIGIVMLDINDFKEVNDRFGHQVGDRVLRSIADRLKDSVRASDSIIRYGGDEFMVILPECNGEMESVVSRIRQGVADNPEEIEDLIRTPVTVAVGTALWHPGEDRSIDMVIAEADSEMYEDKQRHGVSR